MKILFIIITALVFTSCNDSQKLKNLELRVSNIENQNRLLSDSLQSVNTEFIEPFKIYEKIILSEFKNAPNQIISDYEFLIKHYPNSFWIHEAKKRIENVKKRKKYWSKKAGWVFPKKPVIPVNIFESSPIISCPGC